MGNDDALADLEGDAVEPRRRHLVAAIALSLWVALVVFLVVTAARNPSLLNIVACSAFVLLGLSVNAQILLMRWSGNRSWRRLVGKLHGSAYMESGLGLPNRNYLLAELRREMPRARNGETAFVLLQVSLDTVEEVRARRGEAFADRAQRALIDLMRRITRASDFVAHTSGARFVVMLNDCSEEDCWAFLDRVPSTIAVSDGHKMYEVPLTVRFHAYDCEMLYATDVLREAEEAEPLERKEDPAYVAWTEAA